MVHQVPGTGKGPHVGQLCRERARVVLLELRRRTLTQLMPRFPRQALGQQAAAHPDAPVNAPHRQRDAGQLERLAPREGVLVDAVGERTIEVEQQCGTFVHS